jgi:4-amino-4-deoxy-L-arabinose transferase-like glycosyltransferase
MMRFVRGREEAPPHLAGELARREPDALAERRSSPDAARPRRASSPAKWGGASSPLTYLALLLALAFLVRAGAVLALRDIHQRPTGVSTADDVEFDVLARNLAQGKGHADAAGRPTSFRAPGWPIFLAGIYAVAGERPWVVYALCCALGALSCALSYLLAREVTDEATARVAGALAAVYLPHVWFATMFLSENLAVPCLALGLWLFLRHLRTGATWEAALAGLVLGWAALTRPFALLLVPILLVVLLRQTGRWRAGIVLATLAAAVVVPWTVRNHAVHGRLVLIATNGGSTFYGGNNGRVASEVRLLGSWISTTELPHRDLIEAAPNEVEHDKVEWRLGLAWVATHPGRALLLVPLKLARLVFWLPDFDGGGVMSYAARALGYGPFLVLGLVGWWRCPWRGPGWVAIHGALLATALTAVVFWGSPRFRDANAPLLMVYAALGLCWMWRAPSVPLRGPAKPQAAEGPGLALSSR